MRWLVLGATGFIGSHLSRRLRADGYNTIGTGNQRLDDSSIRFNIEQDSIQEVIDPSWFRDDVVAIHCLAHGSIDQYLRDHERVRKLAVEATTRLMAELADLNARQVYLSTNHVFDGVRGGYQELDECRPINEYGRQKLAVEQFLHQSIPSALVLRLDKVIGTGLTDDTVLAPWWRAIESRQPLRSLADQFFTPVIVSDVVQAIVALVHAGKRGTYHVAGPEQISRTELAREFCRACQSSATIIEQTADEMNLLDARPRNASLDISKLRSEIGFRPQSPQSIVAQFVRNYLLRRAGGR